MDKAMIDNRTIVLYNRWGARTYAALPSVMDTAALKDMPPFLAIPALFGTLALPLPTGE
jgi:hypothetical protein